MKEEASNLIKAKRKEVALKLLKEKISMLSLSLIVSKMVNDVSLGEIRNTILKIRFHQFPKWYTMPAETELLSARIMANNINNVDCTLALNGSYYSLNGQGKDLFSLKLHYRSVLPCFFNQKIECFQHGIIGKLEEKFNESINSSINELIDFEYKIKLKQLTKENRYDYSDSYKKQQNKYRFKQYR